MIAVPAWFVQLGLALFFGGALLLKGRPHRVHR